MERTTVLRATAFAGCLLASALLAAAVRGRAEEGGDPTHVRAPLPSRGEIAKLPADGGPEFNRLIFESSPYLLQHARNPVDWYAWGEAAFAKAREENKPIFLSVGYSTCHWCHVMERESFENDEVARILNEQFVAIKVDREERPDVDGVYMAAIQALTGSGGWPMSVFLAPDARPLFGGTYFPPEDRFGRAGFKTILRQVAETWRTRRDDVLEDAERITSHLRSQAAAVGSAELGPDTLRKGLDLYADQFDAGHGGFETAPKFPRSHSLSFLLRHHRRTGDAHTLAMVERTLDAMARGGLFDHLGGGFHRYSTDRKWLVPHFEKMLYDQALLARSYLEAFQVTESARHAAVAREVFRYVLRDLLDPAGGFQSAEDADSEGVEGKFYLWTRAEILAVLGPDDGAWFADLHGVTKDGNYRAEAAEAAAGENILHRPLSPADETRRSGTEAAAFAPRLAALKQKLFAARERRIRPHKDDKVLADWNGLMIGALAYGGAVLEEPAYTEAARRAAGFVLDRMQRDGRLLHRYRDGQVGIPAFLDDYAFFVLGLLDLYEATFEVRWLREAKRLAAEMVRLFRDESGGFLFAAQDDKRLVAPVKELYDGAIPSGNSVATLALLKVGRMTMDDGLEKHGRENLRYFSGHLDRFAMGYPFMLMALDFAVGPSQELVLAGDREAPGMAEFLRAVRRPFHPNLVTVWHPTGAAGAEIEALVPFVQGQVAMDGKATAYVCENFVCRAPTTDAERMSALLRGKK